MKDFHVPARLATLLTVVIAGASCGAQGGAPGDAATEQPVAARSAGTPNTPRADLPPVMVFKNASCGCCNGWVAHMRDAGFEVDARDTEELDAIKVDAGVPAGLASCHTALVDGYVVEGHVPAEIVERLLAERPDVAGLSVPGMVEGSPGMEGPNPRPYQVVAFDHEGHTRVYAEIDPR